MPIESVQGKMLLANDVQFTVRARISENDYAAFKQLEQATGRSQSDLVREAVHQLLARHHLVN
ncbi:MAG TPA: ribbon-helix-helix domain-containing protein [Candidatus Nanopelagicales bacterium]|nr:ribbon-helix-helix domain-containing protein [Candidatus Nanopelagicales bacterium]